MSKVAVIGAGIVGATTAYSLLDRGHEVVLIERRSQPAMETSFANGSQLSASNAEVWNSWATIGKGLRWMLKADAPLLLNPSPSLRKYGWLAEFVSQIPHHRENTIATTRMAIEARKRLFEIAEREAIDFDLERRGILHVYRSKASFDHAAKGNELLKAAGLERGPVTPEEMKAIEPALTGDFYGGFYTPSDATGDAYRFTRGVAAACERRGAVLRMGMHVARIEPTAAGVSLFLRDADAEEDSEVETLAVDAVVICAGVASRGLAAALGDRVNIYPVKGYSITVGLEDETSRRAAPWVSLLDEDAKIVCSRLGAGRLRIAGTAEFNGENRDIRFDRIAPLKAWSQRLFPEVEADAAVAWAGLRPMTPSMMPRVGPGRRPNVFYNTGHGHLGWTLSAATAEMIAEEVDRSFGG